MRLYNRYGEPISEIEWVTEFTWMDSRLRADLIRRYLVSTTYIGLSPSDETRPIIFETAIFHDQRLRHIYHWSTLTEAHLGHVEMLGRLLLNIGASWSEVYPIVDTRPALSAPPGDER